MKTLLSILSRTGVLSLVLLFAMFGMVPSQAQVPSSNPPYNIDTGALITLNAAAASQTINSANQTNVDKSGAVCTAVQSAISGTPSWTFAIQNFDAANQVWNTLVTSSTISTSTSNIYTAWVQSGLIAADVPTNGVGKSVRLPRVWRLSAILGAGSGSPTVTAKIGCNLFR